MALAPPPALNGRPRKQLSDQLDRLDEIINGLAECLPEAVADAARDGIRQAFRDVVAEVVSDPAILDRLRATVLPESGTVTVTPKPSAFARLQAALRAAACRAASLVVRGCARVVSVPRRIVGAVRQSVRQARLGLALTRLLGMPLRTIAAVGLAVGLAAATASYLAPHHVAAAVSGVSTAAMAMGLQVAHWLRRQRLVLAP